MYHTFVQTEGERDPLLSLSSLPRPAQVGPTWPLRPLAEQARVRRGACGQILEVPVLSFPSRPWGFEL